ncbi:unnamed protein product [Lathyrus oleraceus]
MALASQEILTNCISFVRLHNNGKLHEGVILHFFQTPVQSKTGWISILHFFHHSVELHTIKVTYQGDDEEQKESLMGDESGGLCSLSTTQVLPKLFTSDSALCIVHLWHLLAVESTTIFLDWRTKWK